jgi:hypothetical protein
MPKPKPKSKSKSHAKPREVVVFVGTRKGGFIFRSDMRVVPNGTLAVHHSTNAGKTWRTQTRGLPAHDAFHTILREAMSTDACDPAGVYFGAENGQLYQTRNEGGEWHLLADNLPPIMSVEAAIV